MNWSKYSSLKSGDNASFAKEKQTTREAVEAVDEVRDDDGHITTHGVSARAKEEREFVVLVTKSWNGSTGEANADSKREYSLSDLEREKAHLDYEIAQKQAESDGLAAAIVDSKKL